MLCERDALKPYMRWLQPQGKTSSSSTSGQIKDTGRNSSSPCLGIANENTDSKLRAVAQPQYRHQATGKRMQPVSDPLICFSSCTLPNLGTAWPPLHIDYAGPYYGEMFLVVINAYSKWLEVHLNKSNTSIATIEKLREIFITHACQQLLLVSIIPRIYFTRCYPSTLHPTGKINEQFGFLRRVWRK